jgi:hypothetical protein
VSSVGLTDRRGGRRWGRSKIIRRRESLIIFKSFNTLWREETEREGECGARGCMRGVGKRMER